MSIPDKALIPLEKATFSGGCFWCMQHDFDLLPGVVSTTVGYTGGEVPHPTYELVCLGTTGHVEAINILFDPSILSYEKLLEHYWESIDPTQANGQFCDIGPQYTLAIFYHNDCQKELAEKSLQKIRLERKFPVVNVQIKKAGPFYPAEDYHQKYYLKSAFRYNWYATGSGRTERLKEIWKEKSNS